MNEDFLSIYPAFREPLQRGDRIIGEAWFSVWENARAFENARCRKKLLRMFNPDYVIDADECAAAIGLRLEVARLRNIEAAAVAAVDFDEWKGDEWYELMIALQKALCATTERSDEYDCD